MKLPGKRLMWLGLVAGVALALGCKDDPTPLPDAGAGLDATMSPADAATLADAADAARATDAANDAPAVEASTAEAPSDGNGPCVDAGTQTCVQGTMWGCCADYANIPPVCHAGKWECPEYSVWPDQCCGVGTGSGSCGPYTLRPECSAFNAAWDAAHADGGASRD